jgi:hypothetical protein
LYICVKTPARSYVHGGTLACMQDWNGRSGFVVLPQGYLPHSDGGHLLVSCDLLFRLVQWCRLWAIRRSEQRLLASVLCRGRRRQGTRVQGSGTIGGVWSVAVALNTRQGTFARCAARSASTIWLSHCTLGPSRWYLTRMTLLLRPVLEPRTNSTSLVVDNPLIDRNDPVLSAPDAFTSPVVAKTFAFIPAPGSCSAA